MRPATFDKARYQANVVKHGCQPPSIAAIGRKFWLSRSKCVWLAAFAHRKLILHESLCQLARMM